MSDPGGGSASGRGGAAGTGPAPAPARPAGPSGGGDPRAATPPEAPLAMPVQDLRRRPRGARPDRGGGLRVALARLTAFGGAAALTALAAWQITLAFDLESLSRLQAVLGVLFTITFAWIALAGASAVAGVLFGPPRSRLRGPADAPLTARTAIVMPVYNEDPAQTCGALAALGTGLRALGAAEAFEIFVLSDTRDADAWVQETTAFAELRALLGGAPAAWYRRRRLNTARKAGNVQDFVERWGGRYDYMLVLDADSVMAPETVVEMVRRMQADPALGLLQTVPVLAGGGTPFARLQQFAGRLYGGVVARGMAAWSGHDGNFWGHNALIRVRAFAEAAGLPELRGRGPFGGHVLSHDFVEAALLRRAGWRVRMDPDLQGSWEGTPPSLIDASVRDRRWAQGNLQHLNVIGARGLRWPSRVHFAIGIGSYLASPLWLLMLAVGLVLTAQAVWFRPEYFPSAFQLFPTWPRFDALRMTWLFVGSMALLLLPKALGWLGALLRGGGRAFGGPLRLTAGTLAEILISALAAPVMMLMQTRHVCDILLGRDAGWNPQSRAGSALPWGAALRAHGGHAALGLAVGAALFFTQPEVLIWLSPVLIGLILAPFLSRWSGDARLGRAFARLGLMDTPEDRDPPPAFGEAEAAEARIRAAEAAGLAALACDPGLARRHLAGLAAAGEGPPREEGPSLPHITARAKIEAAETPEQALGWLDKEERAALAGSPDLLRAWSPAFREVPAARAG